MSIPFIFVLFFIFVGFVFLTGFFKKMYYRFFKKERCFIIPRLTTTGICNVGMILSLSISIIILLIVMTAGIASTVFRLWAGTRIIFEGILIKISGLLFGPIIGMCLGAATDLLTITYSGGIFHYGYFMSAILFGLFGGMIRKLVKYSKNKNLKFTIISSLTTILISTFSSVLIWVTNVHDVNTIYEVSLMGFEIRVRLEIIILLVTLIPLLGIVFMWLSYFIFILSKKVWKVKKDWYNSFAPVFVLIIVSEIIVNIIFMPVFDATISPLPYETWVLIRLLLYIPMVLINLAIILPVYKIIQPIMKYNYEDGLVESFEKPLEIKITNEQEVKHERN